MAGSELAAKVAELSKASRSLSDTEVDECVRVGTCIERYLQQRAEAFVREHADEPLMICYFADGWSCDLTSRQTVWFAGAPEMKTDKWRGEFVLERGILRAAPSQGESGMRMIMQPPRLLSQGKNSWNAFTAACEFLPMVRCMGHDDVSISVYCLDGHLFSACLKKLKARHQLYYEMQEAAGSDFAELNKAMDWVVGIKCVAHACSNAVKWALTPCNTGECNDDAHKIIAGLRNSSFDLQNQADLFLQRYVRFRAADTPLHLAAQLWLSLAVRSDLMELFIKVDPFWDGAFLYVNQSMADDTDCFALLHTILGHCFKWVDWSDTRWVRMAKSARLFMRSLAVGISGVVELNRADSRSTNETLAYWPRNTAIVRKYMAVAATCAGPAEAVQFQILKDDRMLRFLPLLNHTMQEEVATIRTIDIFTWDRLAYLVGGGLTGQELRGMSLHAALTSIGYLHREAFHQASIEPLCFTQGDIEANVAELAVRVGPVQHPLTQQMRDMLFLGCSQDKLVAALTLLRDASCSIGLVEQAHASGAVLHRAHPGYTERVFRSRIMVHQARALFTPAQTPKVILDQQRTLRRLDKARPEAVSGRQVFLQELVDRVLGSRLLAQDVVVHTTREAFRRHAELYDDLDPAQHDEYDQEAAALAAERREEIDEERHAIRSRIERMEREKSAHRRMHGLPAHADSCRLSNEDLDQAAELFASDNIQALTIDSLPSDQAPRAPASDFQQDIERLQPIPGPAVEQPWWLRMLCFNREAFGSVGLYPDERRRFVYLLLFAKQQPYQATFLKLTRREVLLPLRPRDSHWPAEFRSEYELDDFELMTESELSLSDWEDIWVVRNIRLEPEGAFSNHAAERFERFVMFMPRPTTAPATGGARRRQAPRDYRLQLLEENPFLDPEDLGLGAVTATGRVARPRIGRGPFDEEADDMADGDVDPDDSDWDELDIAAEVIDVVGELSEIRAGIAALGDEDSYFFVMVRGGAWTAEKKGVAADACAGKARSGLPKTWCRFYNFPVMASASFKKYGREAAMELAREFCRRGQFYFRMWLLSEGFSHDDFVYTRAQVNSYVPHADWVEFLAGLGAGSVTYRRAVKLAALHPRIG